MRRRALGDGKLRHLTFVSRRANKIGPDGAKALAASSAGRVPEGSSARANGNRIGDDGAVNSTPPPAASRAASPRSARCILDDNGVGDLEALREQGGALRNYAFAEPGDPVRAGRAAADSEREGRGGTARLVRACAARRRRRGVSGVSKIYYR